MTPDNRLFDQVLKAAISGNSRSLRALLADIDPETVRGEWGVTPLMVACLKGKYAAVKMLVAPSRPPEVNPAPPPK